MKREWAHVMGGRGVNPGLNPGFGVLRFGHRAILLPNDGMSPGGFVMPVIAASATAGLTLQYQKRENEIFFS
jgi:hypothetical protein